MRHTLADARDVVVLHNPSAYFVANIFPIGFLAPIPRDVVSSHEFAIPAHLRWMPSAISVSDLQQCLVCKRRYLDNFP